MRRGWSFVAALAALALAVGSCGGPAPSMTDNAATELQYRAAAVRAAVESHDTVGAERALDELRRMVDRLRRKNALSDTRAADILAAAGVVEDQLVTVTTTTTTTTTVPPPVIDDKDLEPKDKEDEGKGKGEEKGGGNGNEGNEGHGNGGGG